MGWLSAGIAAVSSIYGANKSAQAVSSAADVSRASAREQMKFQEEQNAKQMAHQNAAVQKQMTFQERLSNSAHQREMADLRLAGLNPILAAKYGGSSTPGGSTSSGATSAGAPYSQGVPDTSGYTQAGSSAVQAMRTARETQNIMKQGEILDREVDLAEFDKALYKEYPGLRVAEKVNDISTPGAALAAAWQLKQGVESQSNSAKSYGTEINKFEGIKPIQLSREELQRRKKKNKQHPYDQPGSKLRQQRQRREQLKHYFPSQY